MSALRMVAFGVLELKDASVRYTAQHQGVGNYPVYRSDEKALEHNEELLKLAREELEQHGLLLQKVTVTSRRFKSTAADAPWQLLDAPTKKGAYLIRQCIITDVSFQAACRAAVDTIETRATIARHANEVGGY